MTASLHPRAVGRVEPSVELLLIRHGESALGAQQRYAGHADTPLTERGIQQIRALAPRLAGREVARVLSSDLSRCRASAALLWPRDQITYTSELRELSFGRWEGWRWAECAALDPERHARWLEDPWNLAPPGGETLATLARRAHGFADSLAHELAGHTVALVTHAGWIRVILCRSAEDFWEPHVSFASLHAVHWTPGARAWGS